MFLVTKGVNNKTLKLLIRKKRKSFNKLFLSKPYIKFNNNKFVITLFVFNREKFSRLKNLFKHLNIINKIYKYIYISRKREYISLYLNKLETILNKLKSNLFKFHKS